MLVNGFDQLLTALACQGRNFKHWSLELEAFDKVLDGGSAFVVVHHVQLVEHQPARFLKQRVIVFFKFTHDSFGLRHRINVFVERRQVHHMQQQPGALQVP